MLLCFDEILLFDFSGLCRVEIQNQHTNYWRCHSGLPTTCLSTIEAIYYFVREYSEHVLGEPYMHQFDNILFFFNHYYHIIRGKYKAYDRHMMNKKSKQDAAASDAMNDMWKRTDIILCTYIGILCNNSVQKWTLKYKCVKTIHKTFFYCTAMIYDATITNIYIFSYENCIEFILMSCEWNL